MQLTHQNVFDNLYEKSCKWLPKLPDLPMRWALAIALNQMLKDELADGDFDFLNQRNVAVHLTDFNLTMHVTKLGNRFACPSITSTPDASISASSHDLLQIVLGKEDPDTLFFQRRLTISGDTELGLTTKNRLDAVDKSRVAPWLMRGLVWLDNSLTQHLNPL